MGNWRTKPWIKPETTADGPEGLCCGFLKEGLGEFNKEKRKGASFVPLKALENQREGDKQRTASPDGDRRRLFSKAV